MKSDDTFSAVAIIPCHLASVRFPRKIVEPIKGLPMIEHVRRRALLNKNLERVIVATCDKEIADLVESHGGDVVITARTHTNGTSRVAEAVKDMSYTHILLLQGDEPLLLPRHINTMIQAMKCDSKADAWNATGSITNPEELDKHSFVKCSVSQDSRILYCFRRSPSFSQFSDQIKFTRKILGLIGYRREFITELMTMESTQVEKFEFIEQMRIIENGYTLNSVPVEPSLPSINEPGEVDAVIDCLQNDIEQRMLLDKVRKGWGANGDT